MLQSQDRQHPGYTGAGQRMRVRQRERWGGKMEESNSVWAIESKVRGEVEKEIKKLSMRFIFYIFSKSCN